LILSGMASAYVLRWAGTRRAEGRARRAAREATRKVFMMGERVGEDTHLTRLGGDVDLNNVLRLVDGLVREGEGELDLVGDGLGVCPALGGNSQG
jgi:hypothetical protein